MLILRDESRLRQHFFEFLKRIRAGFGNRFVKLHVLTTELDMSSLIDSLNPQQKAAVTLPEVSSLILAGAGSGKTRVLTSRIAYLLEQQAVSPGEILAVTFTNKAAKEMLTRLTAQVPFNTRAMWIGTFHGLCNRMLRMHHEQASLPATFAILDQGEQLSAIKRIMKANKISEEVLNPREVQQFINSAKEEGKRASQVQVFGYNGQAKLQVYQWYEDLMNREGSCDFAELLLRSYELLSRNEMIRRHYQDRFRFILVDEFQDTNVLQYRWLKLLSGVEEPGRVPNAVFAVGDDDQSIYAFRGANVGNMQDFVRDFHIENTIRLEQNYRSHGYILEAANRLISNNSERLGKNLWTDAGKGEKIRVFGAQTDVEEAEFLVDAIKGYINDGIDRREIAVLYRSNAQSRIIEAELTRRGVPYKVYGGQRFYDRAEIKHAIAYMRLAENTADDSAFLRVVNFPARGIGAKTVDTLVETAKQTGMSLFDACRTITGAAGNKLAVFTSIVEDLAEQKTLMDLPSFVDYAIERSTLKQFYETERNGEERLENLKELRSAAQGYLSEERIDPTAANAEFGDDNLSPLAGFLSAATLESGDNQARNDEAAVQLMTIHASKGLEFNVVFITGLESGLFPHDSAMKDPKGLEEERRLMYVAITRARKILYLTYAKQRMLHGMTRYNIRSSFFDEIPEETLKWLSPKDEGRSFGSRDGFGNDDTIRFGRRSEGYGSDFGGGYSRSGYHGDKPRRYDTNTPDWAKDILGGKAERRQTERLREKAQSGSPFRKGVKIQHEKFGPGVIADTKNGGDDLEITVRFDCGKVVTLLARIAQKKITFI